MREEKKKLIVSIVDKAISIVEALYTKKTYMFEGYCFNVLKDMYDAIVSIESAVFKSYHKKIINFNDAKKVIENILKEFQKENYIFDVKKELIVLLTSLENIEVELNSKIICKREILFMPYQVSMWDSLESIWIAAKQDKEVECLVMPIPYFDIVDGKVQGELHYDGNQYPPYVPIVNYQEYDFEEHMPDVVFIHNPYDQYNSVTRIPEKFYSSNIKKYIKKLVYVPYYVTEEDGPSDLSCIMPGVLYSDYVVVQGGKVYERFCKKYTEYIEKNNLQDKFRSADMKFLPLGSPKFDKLLNMHIEVADLPDQWKRKIYKKDGSTKKIIFYNTTIASFLQNADAMIKKIDSVFTFFATQKEEVVLLWRPHPLLLKTINSMRPNYKNVYFKKIEYFKEQEWGIFDETADPDLAMSVSDAYYGDMSSLLTVYKMTGKPILIQNINLQ